MKNLINAFVKDEDGAVTVDWVVLTAAIVGIALAIIAVVNKGLTNAASSIAKGLSDAMTSALT